jgi:thioredoxin 1
MDSQAFFEKLKQNPRPVIVDLWAPWCGPCKLVKPILEKLAQEYAGRVDLWQINADENQELLQQLKVYGIPTLIVYRAGKETLRQVGAKPRQRPENSVRDARHRQRPRSRRAFKPGSFHPHWSGFCRCRAWLGNPR